ncbi:MAG: hypothetical protein OXI34_14105 [Chloroflexota bacterium]|nr:hypothetical protein [Chloroflexota bacterium]MDE2947909.1 hypothetical protein [Chloroflexota bacterium]
MHEKVPRPDYADVDDTDLRDIRYRLNVLDHKLDKVLSLFKLLGEVSVESASVYKQVARNTQWTRDYMNTVANFMELTIISDEQVESRLESIDDTQGAILVIIRDLSKGLLDIPILDTSVIGRLLEDQEKILAALKTDSNTVDSLLDDITDSN